MEKIAGECFLVVREADAPLLLAKGYNQRGIAGKLDVSDNTVRTHMHNPYRKLRIHSRQDAIELGEGFGRGEGARDLSKVSCVAALAKKIGHVCVLIRPSRQVRRLCIASPQVGSVRILSLPTQSELKRKHAVFFGLQQTWRRSVAL